MNEPFKLGIRAAAGQIGNGDLRPSDLLESCLERIHAREPFVRAWEVLDVEGARIQAKDRDNRSPVSPLHGLPVGIKDIIDVAGLPTRCGSALRDGRPAARDARITSRLRAAGAVILGKTVTTEFAYFTPGKTRNPHDAARTPGGSSSGSAAAVADHMVPIGLGTQTAASTIRPAAYCGVAGLVTSPGQFHDPGTTGLSPTLDSLGLLTRSVDDLTLVAAELLDIVPLQDLTRAPALAVCHGDDFGDLTDPMRAAIENAVRVLRKGGASTEKLRLPHSLAALLESHRTVMAVEASRSLAAEARTGRLSESLQSLLDRGQATSAPDYRRAVEHARQQRAALLAHLSGYDAILTPAAAGAAPVGTATGSPDFSRPWQAMGMPSVTVAGVHDQDGMPLGIQLIGRPSDVPHLLAVARWVENHLGHVVVS
jgi:Asp-tRNA(Asn)/Glu-tRNA(Gln) amidotransferase A subunit family amidase